MSNNNKITKVTRRDILLSLLREKVDVETALRSYFDFSKFSSFDGRYKDMDGDFHQHRINNYDWDDEWFIDDKRLQILELSDDDFLALLCKVIHPELLLEKEILDIILSIYNSKLGRDGFEIVPGEEISGQPVFIGRRMTFENSIQFYTSAHHGTRKPPYLLLTIDNWDDFTYKTTYYTTFVTKDGDNIDIGQVKVLQEGVHSTELPTEFKQLSSDFFSLFQGAEVYRNLADPRVIRYSVGIKKGLNDVTSNKSILEKARKVPGFSDSLIRFTEAYSLLNESAPDSVSFTFKKNNRSPGVNFDFDTNTELPFRMNVLIGKNGGGKTTMLSDLATAIVQHGEEMYTHQVNPRPAFSKVITISYSVFDSFNMPNNFDKVRYAYCGLKKEDGSVDINRLERRLGDALKTVVSKDGITLWQHILKDLLGGEMVDPSTIGEAFTKMSSGQKLLVTIFSEILANIEQKSLLLFDEPETHLHPNMTFKLIKALSTLLETYDSYGILATHSPIVLQQVPSKYIRIIERIGGEARVDRLEIESFGENFSNITKEVFGAYEASDVMYRELFEKLSKDYSEEQIRNIFDNKLGLNASIYLRALFNEKKNEESSN